MNRDTQKYKSRHEHKYKYKYKQISSFTNLSHSLINTRKYWCCSECKHRYRETQNQNKQLKKYKYKTALQNLILIDWVIDLKVLDSLLKLVVLWICSTMWPVGEMKIQKGRLDFQLFLYPFKFHSKVVQFIFSSVKFASLWKVTCFIWTSRTEFGQQMRSRAYLYYNLYW